VWEKREQTAAAFRITEGHYKAVGGWDNALNEHADAVWNNLGARRGQAHASKADREGAGGPRSPAAPRRCGNWLRLRTSHFVQLRDFHFERSAKNPELEVPGLKLFRISRSLEELLPQMIPRRGYGSESGKKKRRWHANSGDIPRGSTKPR
jgi:hypothetical protein